jgi:hypothetical protein
LQNSREFCKVYFFLATGMGRDNKYR